MKTRRATRRPRNQKKQTAQEKAAMMALRAKGISPGRSQAAKQAWQTRYAKLPDVPRGELRRIEAMRGERAMSADARRTGAVVLKPGDKRVFYWTRRPGGYDVAGIDTEGARQPKPIDADRNAPFLKFRREAEQRRRLREKVSPRPERPAASSSPAAPSREVPSVDAMKAEAERILGKPTTTKAPPSNARLEKLTEGDLKHLLYGDRKHAKLAAAKRIDPKPLAGLNYDLGKGGALYSLDKMMAVFRRDAKPLPDAERDRLQRAEVPVTTSLLSGLKRERYVADLDAYLKAVHGNPRHVPIGGSLFDRKRIEKIAHAFRGPVEIEVGNDLPITISKGNLSVMMAPVIPGEDDGGAWGSFASGLPGGKPKPAMPSPMPKTAPPPAPKVPPPAAKPAPAKIPPAAKPTPKAPAPQKAPAKPATKAASAAKAGKTPKP
ncbi:MAG: hypothetical protein LC623_02220 [Halobacteriales archaeon]|nr:hypothetical protein [Halobacteriales archaeon]